MLHVHYSLVLFGKVTENGTKNPRQSPEIGCRGWCLNPGKEFLLNLGLIFAESDLFADFADGLGDWY